VVSLFETIDDSLLTDIDRARFHFLYSDLFVHYRQLDPALSQLSESFLYNPSAKIPIRQAIISASADNYEDALVFLQRAREANRRQSILLPSFEQEIVGMERDIQRILESR